ncbi:MAG: hypothetical protein JW947_09255 [Sedimentisphaerales bacterium]|nr:hypothetical protein [Sedimentisphaerales bacterium]
MKNTRFACNILTFYLVTVCPFVAYGTSFTLSDDAIMKLDYEYYGSQNIVSITNVNGPGVRFDIQYLDPQNIRGESPTFYWVSSIRGGNGDLVGIDISEFDAFALNFTLLSVTGANRTDAPIIVGSYIRNSYKPEVISLAQPFASSITTTDANQITTVGFVCNIPYWWYDDNSSPWDPDGAIISLLVEQTPGAAVITPEPTALLFLCAGIIFLRRKS